MHLGLGFVKSRHLRSNISMWREGLLRALQTEILLHKVACCLFLISRHSARTSAELASYRNNSVLRYLSSL